MLDNAPRIDPLDELVCLGHEEDLEAQGGALAPPIVQTSLFAQPSLDDLARGLEAESRHHVYTRGRNPTVEAVEKKIARLERAEGARVFGSGMAAIAAVLHTFLESGDHLLFVNQTYGPTLALARRLERFGVRHDLLLELDPESFAASLRPETRLVWIESPGTMLFRLADVESLAAMAHERGILLALDNSWATPLYQKPLLSGVDLVVHSATKYLAGHSDLLAGAVAGREDLLARVFEHGFMLLGGLLSPFDAWLLNRGLRTLPVRMRQHHAGGLAVARWLAGHPKVRRVFHPALASGAESVLAGRLTGFSGLLSCELAVDRYADLRTMVDRLRRFRIGVSWGGVESLVLAPNRGSNLEVLAAQGIPAGTIRLSVGLEPPEILIEDLEGALATL